MTRKQPKTPTRRKVHRKAKETEKSFQRSRSKSEADKRGRKHMKARAFATDFFLSR